MSLVPEIHLTLAIVALVLLLIEDWSHFEIAPQWVIIASVNIIAFNLSIGLSPQDIFTGFIIWSGSIVVIYGALNFLGRKNGIGRGDLYSIPLLGLAAAHDLLIPSLTLFVCTSFPFLIWFSWMRGKRGRQMMYSTAPLGPPLAVTIILLLINRFASAEYWPSIPLPASWITFIAAGVFLISICALFWRVYEFIIDSKPNGVFPNPWD